MVFFPRFLMSYILPCDKTTNRLRANKGGAAFWPKLSSVLDLSLGLGFCSGVFGVPEFLGRRCRTSVGHWRLSGTYFFRSLTCMRDLNVKPTAPESKSKSRQASATHSLHFHAGMEHPKPETLKPLKACSCVEFAWRLGLNPKLEFRVHF